MIKMAFYIQGEECGKEQIAPWAAQEQMNKVSSKNRYISFGGLSGG